MPKQQLKTKDSVTVVKSYRKASAHTNTFVMLFTVKGQAAHAPYVSLVTVYVVKGRGVGVEVPSAHCTLFAARDEVQVSFATEHDELQDGLRVCVWHVIALLYHVI
jgi:hypothetical protein